MSRPNSYPVQRVTRSNQTLYTIYKPSIAWEAFLLSDFKRYQRRRRISIQSLASVCRSRCGSSRLQHRRDELQNEGGNFLCGWTVRQSGPRFGSSVNCPACTRRDDFGGEPACRRSFFRAFHSFKKNPSDCMDYRRINQWFERALVLINRAARRVTLGEIITHRQNDRPRRSGTRPVIGNFSFVKQRVKTTRNHRFQERKLIRIMIVECRPIHRGCLGDVLDRNFVEALGLQESPQSTLKQLPRAADARVANFAI